MQVSIDAKSFCDEIAKKVSAGVESLIIPEFIPTGCLEPVIIEIGKRARKGKTLIINLQYANKVGKTTIAVNILRNILWEYDKQYFDYPAYRQWPFTQDKYDKDGKLVEIGPQIKSFRIIGTADNTSDNGPIKDEIAKWWPKGRYKALKGGKNYTRLYETDTGWDGDVMTYEQEPKEFEGKLLSIQWLDEPAKASLMGAINSRFQQGGVLIISHTPIGAGPMLDILDDLKEKGADVVTISGSLYDNSVTSGPLNSKGTKRGLMTDESIENYISTIPESERNARVWGKNMGKSGKVYPKYSDIIHVKDQELNSKFAKQWNCYCVFDPHDKYYPFFAWIAVTPPDARGKERYIIYNEWPTVDTLGGYYDEKRNSVECKLSPKDISQIVKIFDGTEFGLSIMGRGIDPRFARNSKADFSKRTQGIVVEYQAHGLLFNLPDLDRIQAQRGKIIECLDYDEMLPVNEYNYPLLTIMPHCENMRRALSRHYWEPDEKNVGKETEAEQYKDPIDCLRIFFALIANKRYTPVTLQQNKNTEIKKSINTAYDGLLREIKLS